jgi:5'-3' exonuclease, N-terminal resolvase-like domain/T4 RNase H, C terminal
MILLDLSQVMISHIMAQAGSHADNIEIDLVRHTVINKIREQRSKHHVKYGELVIAADSRHYWRRDLFPAYKGNRKQDRERSGFDWHYLFDTLNTLKEEIKENMPYPVIQVEGAEADDVIGTMVFEQREPLNNGEPILILSGDKDFVQLQRYPNVQQFDPLRNRQVTADDPNDFLRRLILSGDRGDGVPNVLSPDNCIIEGQRQKPLHDTRITQMLSQPFEDLPADIQRNWKRNELMIDLRYIPSDIRTKINNEYQQQLGKPRTKLFNYFITHRMRVMMEHIGDF